MVERFKIAAYTRISVDMELNRDNTSIENQKAIIGEYCRLHFPTSTVDYFEDRDYSGYTFEQRPDYMRMRRLLMEKQYDILIVKDLSRFSRRTGKGLAEFEDLIEKDVRIIAIGDGVDYPTNSDWMKIKLYFFVNEMPVTDASEKVTAVIANRQSKGEWICSVPYGYVMTNTKRMLFEVDESAAEVIREIFRLYLDGWGYKRIANHLTAKHIPTPRMCEKMRKEAAGDEYRGRVKEAWSIVTIAEILCNDFYIGTLRQRKFHRKKINGQDMPLDESEHLVFENHHAPIISYEMFATTREQLKLRSTGHYRGQKKYENNYSGFLFCGDCGSPMFSRSRPDLADAYICGTYHTRSRAGCTTHHIRVDILDDLLKSYVKKICADSADMITLLEQQLANEPHAIADSTSAAEALSAQIAEEKEALKIMMRQKVRDISRAGSNATVLEQTYDAMIMETTNKIEGLENQLMMVMDTHNTTVRATRHARTVLEIFRGIAEKKKLDRTDLTLIIDRIIVYEDRLEIQLKEDVDRLLRCGTLQTELEGCSAANFDKDRENIEKATTDAPLVAVQSAEKRPDKVFSVNVVSVGDPLEIFTDRDGEVIFKKYSPVGELGAFAGEYAETLHKTCALSVVICDRDAVIATAGVPRREYADKSLSEEMERIIEGRSLYVKREGTEPITAIAEGGLPVRCAMPILSEGDIVGCVVSLGGEQEEKKLPALDVETKLIQTAAGFLGRQLEN